MAVLRALQSRSAQSWMLLGLRGVGKTVLLSEVLNFAEEQGAATAFVESPETGKLPRLLFPALRKVLRQLSVSENAKSLAYSATRALRSFASVFKIELGETTLSVDPEPGVADTGDLETDLPDLLGAVGRAAQAAGTALILFVDEVQYLSAKELAALIRSLHYTNQRGLPVLFFGAGLPQVAAQSGDAKSYAERLFVFHTIDALPEESAKRAIAGPIDREGESITTEALDRVIEHTNGYPYFLQEWGFQTWNLAETSPIGADVVRRAIERAIARLDGSFFKVRFDRLTLKEKEYVFAMSRLPGEGPYRSSDVANELGEDSNKLGTRRTHIIRKGMIYSPAYGDIAFTVPGFKAYLHRLRQTEG